MGSAYAIDLRTLDSVFVDIPHATHRTVEVDDSKPHIRELLEQMRKTALILVAKLLAFGGFR
jgi:hypothetical protein